MLRREPIACHCGVCDRDYMRPRNRGNMAVCSPCQRKKRLSDWNSAHPGKKNDYNRKWSAANKDREADMKKKWGHANKPALCHKAAIHRAKKRNATPQWADIEKIKMIYLNCPDGYHVDHIIPLNGALVTGLHVENNLQYLSAYDNRSKSNKFHEGNP